MKINDMIFAAVMMLLAVVLGAFGAHKLKEFLSFEQLASFKTGVRYQMIHALTILILAQSSFAFLGDRQWMMMMFKIGIVLFSFSIYILMMGKIIELPTLSKIMGPITPLGGLSLIIGWVMLIAALIKSKSM